MKTDASLYYYLAAGLLIALSSSGIAAAACSEVASGFGTDSCYGFDALAGENSSAYNSAFGYLALYSNTAGSSNTAVGAQALYSNTSIGGLAGDNNTATGDEALFSNTIGSGNTATGQAALYHNGEGAETSETGQGEYNTATGYEALQFNTTGSNNTAIGVNALGQSSTGSNNIGIGYQAGYEIATGSNNIEIGSSGPPGDSDTIRIGVQGEQTDTYVAGIFGNKKTKGCEVVVENTGQLHCVKSSARYKRDIHDMGRSSEGLMKLRPVTFRYKADPDGTRQYGLVAEEVARVYPELVVRDADGKVESVSYWMLTSMLLNELQKQAAQMADVKASMRRQAAELRASRERELATRTAFEERLSKLELVMAAKHGSRNLAAAFNR